MDHDANSPDEDVEAAEPEPLDDDTVLAVLEQLDQLDGAD